MDVHEEFVKVFDDVRILLGGEFHSSVDLDDAKSIGASLFECYGRIRHLCAIADISLPEVGPLGGDSLEVTCDKIIGQVESLELIIAMKRGENSVRVKYETGLVSLSKSQVEEIENHIKEAREKIRDSDAFEEKHKRRLLKRLEKLQSEIDKKISDLDVMLAGVTEVTAVAGQSAKNLNPVVDLFKKIFQIADSSSDEPLQLPAPPKQISHQSNKEDPGG